MTQSGLDRLHHQVRSAQGAVQVAFQRCDRRAELVLEELDKERETMR